MYIFKVGDRVKVHKERGYTDGMWRIVGKVYPASSPTWRLVPLFDIDVEELVIYEAHLYVDHECRMARLQDLKAAKLRNSMIGRKP